jgi:hypothetical protein
MVWYIFGVSGVSVVVSESGRSVGVSRIRVDIFD